jgi:hypothetical protein
MNKVVFIAIFLYSFISVCFSQSDRKTIIDNRIKAVTKIVYREPNNKKRETKTYYTVKGDDSLAIINGEEAHSFKAIVEKGRIVQLDRMSGGIIDQKHFYKYFPDSSYSIEILSYEEDRSEYHKYNSRNDCLLTVLNNSDSMWYKYNLLGNAESITHLKNGKKTEIKITQMNVTGRPIRVEYKTDGALWGFSTYKYNEKGLQEEVKIFAIEGNIETLMSKTQLKYDFYFP